MCLIIDANIAGSFVRDPLLPRNEVIHKWLTSDDGHLTIGGKLTKELCKVQPMKRLIAELLRAGRAFAVDENEIESALGKLPKECQSNDGHIIALARVSATRLIFSDDRLLHADFRDPILISHPRGSVYSSETHKHLLNDIHRCNGT